MAKPIKQATRVIMRNKEQDEQHEHKFNADEQHADAHTGLQGDFVTRVWLAFEAGERAARIGEGIDTDAKPGDAGAAANADDAEHQDDEHLDGGEMLQETKIENDDGANECFQNQQKLDLGNSTSYRFRKSARKFRASNCERRILQLVIDHQAENQAQRHDEQAARE